MNYPCIVLTSQNLDFSDIGSKLNEIQVCIGKTESSYLCLISHFEPEVTLKNFLKATRMGTCSGFSLEFCNTAVEAKLINDLGNEEYNEFLIQSNNVIMFMTIENKRKLRNELKLMSPAQFKKEKQRLCDEYSISTTTVNYHYNVVMNDKTQTKSNPVREKKPEEVPQQLVSNASPVGDVVVINSNPKVKSFKVVIAGAIIESETALRVNGVVIEPA